MADLVDLSGAMEKRDERRRDQPMLVTVGMWEDLHDQVLKTTRLLQKLANLAAGTQKRQVEMRADLMEAGAFEKKRKSSILLPEDLN